MSSHSYRLRFSENAIPEEVLAAFRQRDSDEKERRANRLAELRSKLQG